MKCYKISFDNGFKYQTHNNFFNGIEGVLHPLHSTAFYFTSPSPVFVLPVFSTWFSVSGHIEFHTIFSTFCSSVSVFASYFYSVILIFFFCFKFSFFARLVFISFLYFSRFNYLGHFLPVSIATPYLTPFEKSFNFSVCWQIWHPSMDA